MRANLLPPNAVIPAQARPLTLRLEQSAKQSGIAASELAEEIGETESFVTAAISQLRALRN
jgi:hypothetical protein